jgi:integrase
MKSMALPETTTPEHLARHLGWSPKRVRRLAKELGACRILGNRMALLPDDVQRILEHTQPCPSKSIGVREALTGTTEGRLPDIDAAGLLATRVASEIENQHWKRRLDGPQEVLTFAKAAAIYIAGKKPTRFIAPLLKYWGDTKVVDINKGSIRQSAIDIYPTAKPATWNRQVIVPTQAIINHCAESNLCPHIKVKRFKFETKEKRPVTLQWLEAFCRYAPRPDTAALALFMFATGARISEALAVQWGDIDFKARSVLIRQTKLGDERRANLPQALLLALANLPRKAKPFAFARAVSAERSWKRAIKDAGIEPLTFHACRHGFATALLRAGVDVVTIAKLGGWKTPAHVFQTYGHAQDDATITNRLFDTEADTVAKRNEQIQSLK